LRRSTNDRQRQSRGRSSDNDTLYGNTPDPVSFPSISAHFSAVELEATVSMYNAEKGFGFVALADGSGDAFLHVSALQAIGVQSVAAGSILKVRVGTGQKGRQVEQVLSVAEGAAGTPLPGRSPSGRGQTRDGSRGGAEASSAADIAGTVKWYNAEKGFGFISPGDGGKDVFVHATALQRAGITNLNDGQSVRMKVVQGQKGLEVAAISLA